MKIQYGFNGIRRSAYRIYRKRETDDKIVIFGNYNYRFDVPNSRIKKVGRNVILNVDYHELFKYKVDRNAPLPTGEPIEKLGEEQ